MKGWIQLHRKLTQNPLWTAEPFTRGQAWVDLLILANFKDGHIRVRGVRVEIKRGQTGWSLEKLSDRWSWSRGKVKRFLNELETDQQIVQQKNRITTVITIVNYNDYQTDGTTNSTTSDTTDGTTDGPQTVQQTDTKNNVNNINNEKNDNNSTPLASRFPKTVKILNELVPGREIALVSALNADGLNDELSHKALDQFKSMSEDRRYYPICLPEKICDSVRRILSEDGSRRNKEPEYYPPSLPPNGGTLLK